MALASPDCTAVVQRLTSGRLVMEKSPRMMPVISSGPLKPAMNSTGKPTRLAVMTEMGNVFPPVPVMPALMGFLAVFICLSDLHWSLPALVVACMKYGLDT